MIRTRVRTERDPQLEQLKRQSEVAGLTYMNIEDRAYLKTKTREEKGRVAVDFKRLFVDGDEQQNILLASGDVIFFPLQRHTISVSGQVQRAGLIDYELGRKVRYYITKAGGYLYDADRRHARLVRARTGVREETQRQPASRGRRTKYGYPRRSASTTGHHPGHLIPPSSYPDPRGLVEGGFFVEQGSQGALLDEYPTQRNRHH